MTVTLPSTRPQDRPAARRLPRAQEPPDSIGRHHAIHLPSRPGAAGSLAFEVFLEAARPKLESLLASGEVPAEDAEDLVQDSLLTLLEHDRSGIDNREGWLLGTLRLNILQYWRRRARQRRLLELLSRAMAVSQPALQERQDATRDLLALTAHLPPRAIMVLWLRIGLGLKPREVARILRCRPDSVRKLTRRALERVQRDLAAAGHLQALRPAAPAARPTRRSAAERRPARLAAATRSPTAVPIATIPTVRRLRARRGQARRGRTPDRAGASATPPPAGRHRP